MTIKVLFEPKPLQWGLRGDPYLWEAMRNNFAETPIPNDTENLDTLIRQQFKEITSHSLDEVKLFKMKQFNNGGMSGGGVFPQNFGALQLYRFYSNVCLILPTKIDLVLGDRFWV